MKKLLIICSIFILLPKYLLADVGDIYYCETIFSRGVVKGDSYNEWVEKNYLKEKFSFKLTEDKVIFNKQRENSWINFELPVTNLYSALDVFLASNNSSILEYHKGNFLYVSNFGDTFGVSYTYATCEIF